MVRLGLAAAAFAGSASAQTLVDATTPKALVAEIQKLGYRASLTTDSGGDPMIQSAAEGVDFIILFYGCENNAACKAVQFHAGFATGGGFDWARLNDWNQRTLVGRAYLDEEGDPAVDMWLNLDGGVSAANFADSYDWWTVALRDFRAMIAE